MHTDVIKTIKSSFFSNLITKERICQLLSPRFKMADHFIENITTNLVNPFESV